MFHRVPTVTVSVFFQVVCNLAASNLEKTAAVNNQSEKQEMQAKYMILQKYTIL